MNHLFTPALLAAMIAFFPIHSEAKGCLKGAVVGGVAGHVAGQHAVVGAAAGCAIAHHREKVADQKAAAAAARQASPDMTIEPTSPPKK